MNDPQKSPPPSDQRGDEETMKPDTSKPSVNAGFDPLNLGPQLRNICRLAARNRREGRTCPGAEIGESRVERYRRMTGRQSILTHGFVAWMERGSR